MCYQAVEHVRREGCIEVLQFMKRTVSCDRFPRRRCGERESRHCGVCTSCLLRRTALLAAGSEWLRNDTDYRVQVAADAALLARQRFNEFAMSAQVERLRHALRSRNPWLGLVKEFPGLWTVRNAMADACRGGEDVERKVVRLYSQYLAEWDAFLIHSAKVGKEGDAMAGIA